MGSLSTKLLVWMGAALALVFVALEAAHLRVARRSLEQDSIATAERIADVIQRSTRHSMLRNSREDVYHIIRSIGVQPIVRRIRIFNKLGQINYSTNDAEMNTFVDRNAEACAGCHAGSQPLEKLPGPDRARIYRLAGERVVGVIRSIENEPGCSGAPCHAHPPAQRVLGVLDVVLSLEPAEKSLREHERRIGGLTLLFGVLLLGLLSILVLHMVRHPVERLMRGTAELGKGNLRYRLALDRKDEIGKLASAFNHMADELEQARDEITGWNRELERRVEDKSAELARAQQRLVHSEKLASLGQMAAAVAHEINNPLAGILTYARLLEKKIAADGEIHSWLEIIQRESKRCGQIAGNLLAFARNKPVEMAQASINAIVERALAVVQHQLGLQQVELETVLGPDLPPVECDASQIEQVVMALVMNGVESMAGGGRLRVQTRRAGPEQVEIAVSDNGPPIPAEALPRLFEPFFTTKQTTGGAGLGLAVSYGIVRRHGGEILVETGAETTFRVRLPLRGDAS